MPLPRDSGSKGSDDGDVVIIMDTVEACPKRVLRPRLLPPWEEEDIFQGQINCPQSHGLLVNTRKGCNRILCRKVDCIHSKECESFCFFCKGPTPTRGCEAEDCGIGTIYLNDFLKKIMQHMSLHGTDVHAVKTWPQLKAYFISRCQGLQGGGKASLLKIALSIPRHVCTEGIVANIHRSSAAKVSASGFDLTQVKLEQEQARSWLPADEMELNELYVDWVECGKSKSIWRDIQSGYSIVQHMYAAFRSALSSDGDKFELLDALRWALIERRSS